jgi:hypothetical protein
MSDVKDFTKTAQAVIVASNEVEEMIAYQVFLGELVKTLNASPLDTKTRLRTYDEIVGAMKERLKEKRRGAK